MTEIQETRKYLTRRLRDIDYKKSDNICSLFGTHKDRSPRNYKELIEWIKKGHYRLDEKRVKYIDASIEEHDDDFFLGFGAFDGIIWTGRGEFDGEAYSKAQEERNKKYNDTLDSINVLSSEDGLKALKAFEEWMPKGPKN